MGWGHLCVSVIMERWTDDGKLMGGAKWTGGLEMEQFPPHSAIINWLQFKMPTLLQEMMHRH